MPSVTWSERSWLASVVSALTRSINELIEAAQTVVIQV